MRHAPSCFQFFAQLSWAILILVFRVARDASTLTRVLPLERSSGTPDQGYVFKLDAFFGSNISFEH
jgi:hypothetical protein